VVSLGSATEVSDTPFALGTFSAVDERPFAGIMLADHVMPVHSLAPSLRGNGIDHASCAPLLALLEHWPAAFAALEQGLRQAVSRKLQDGDEVVGTITGLGARRNRFVLDRA
jgi:hypothetical protein